MENLYAIIGSWTNEDNSKEWDLLSGPDSLETAQSTLETIQSKVYTDAKWLEHNEYIVTWEKFQQMIIDEDVS
jgi:hypothetical protein